MNIFTWICSRVMSFECIFNDFYEMIYSCFFRSRYICNLTLLFEYFTFSYMQEMKVSNYVMIKICKYTKYYYCIKLLFRNMKSIIFPKSAVQQNDEVITITFSNIGFQTIFLFRNESRIGRYSSDDYQRGMFRQRQLLKNNRGE